MTPDTYIVSKLPVKLLKINVSNQTKKLVLDSEDNRWVEITDGGQQKLSNQQVAVVADLVLKLEEHFGFAVDVEWTFKAGELYVLQCRPITTLK